MTGHTNQEAHRLQNNLQYTAAWQSSSLRQGVGSHDTATPTLHKTVLFREPKVVAAMRNHSPDRSAAAAAWEADEAVGRLPDRLCSKGFKALTTMLMLGRNSPSYCTQRAATAAIWCTKTKHSLNARFVVIFCPSKPHIIKTSAVLFGAGSVKCYVVKLYFQVYMGISLVP
jgi:hypothetical protein